MLFQTVLLIAVSLFAYSLFKKRRWLWLFIIVAIAGYQYGQPYSKNAQTNIKTSQSQMQQ